MNLDWLDRRIPRVSIDPDWGIVRRELEQERSSYSELAQQGINIALLMRASGLSVAATVAQINNSTRSRLWVGAALWGEDPPPWNESKVRRRLARAKAEVLAYDRARECECGCRKRLPPSATAARRYYNDACRVRAHRRRRGGRRRNRASSSKKSSRGGRGK